MCPSLPQPPLPDQNQKPVAPFPEKESSRDIAVHLTVYDWNLFSNIQHMEYIYHMFGKHKFGKITTNLDLLISRFNQVSKWDGVEYPLRYLGSVERWSLEGCGQWRAPFKVSEEWRVPLRCVCGGGGGGFPLRYVGRNEVLFKMCVCGGGGDVGWRVPFKMCGEE